MTPGGHTGLVVTGLREPTLTAREQREPRSHHYASHPALRRTLPIMKLSNQSDAVWTTQQDEELRRLLAAGRSVNEIAIRFRRSPLAIRTRIKKLGSKPDIRAPGS